MEPQSIEAFIKKHGLRMSAVRAEHNPNMSDMLPGSTHWRCTIRRAGYRARMVIPFSQGPAHHDPPTLETVLDCLASDAAGVFEGQHFEDWCAEYGFDTDSRKAEKIYRAVSRQTGKLERFLGTRGAKELLYETGRL